MEEFASELGLRVAVFGSDDEEGKAEEVDLEDVRRTCTVCNVIFPRKVGLDNHLRSRQHKLKMDQDAKGGGGEDGVDYVEKRCTVCNKSYASLVSLLHHVKSRKHLLNVNPDKIVEELCGGGDEKEMELEFDMDAMKCNICKVDFITRKALIIHLKSDKHAKRMEVEYGGGAGRNPEKEKPFYCKVCQTGFKSKYNWRDHLKTEKHQLKVKEREVVKRKLGDDGEEVEDEEEVKGGDALWFCNVCNFKLSTKQMFEQHLKTNRHLQGVAEGGYVPPPSKKEKSFYCDVCEKGFDSERSLQRHFETKRHNIRLNGLGEWRKGGEEEENGGVLFRCAVCNEGCTSEEALKAHFAENHLEEGQSSSASTAHGGGIESFWEEDDDKGDSGGAEVEPEPEFNLDRKKCNICKANFGEKSKLLRHLKSDKHFRRMAEDWTEDGKKEKPFECKICHVRYKQNFQLSRHLKTETHLMKKREWREGGNLEGDNFL